MKEQIVEAWMINNRANLLLIDAISDEGLECSLSKRGGRTVAQQFAHLHNVRLQWLKVSGRSLLAGQGKIDSKGAADRAELSSRLTESGIAIAKLLEQGVENQGKIKGFKRGVVPAMAYFIAHDAHHRGNILLTLKQSGHKVPEETQYGIWDWNRI